MFSRKKQIIIGIIVLFLIITCFSGCNESINKNNIKNKLIGIWNGVSYYQNDSNNITITFYEDNTAKQIDDYSHTHWFNYEIDNNCLNLILPDLPPDYAICYSYEFSNNYQSLTLKNESLDTIALNKEQ